MATRDKYNFKNLHLFCEENNIILSENYENIKLGQKSRIIGVCLTENCNQQFDKSFSNLFIRKGYCEECTKKNKLIKQKQTFITKYGVENPNKLQNIREKIKKTSLEKYGVEYYSQTKEFNDKFKKTCFEKYGVENPNQNKDIKEKAKKTNLENTVARIQFKMKLLKIK